ncbi:MAG: carbonic anhydrase [Pseudolabrys sp.]
MNRRHALQALAGLALCPLCARAGLAAGPPWGYEGAHGPDHWGEIDAASKVCGAGTQQSPIDIEHPIKAQLPPIKIAWHDRCKTIVNNGHTIQLDVVPGSTLAMGNDAYALVQFNFHHPSEHTIAGKTYPMEAHFVHRNDDGTLAVLAVMLKAGSSNTVFKKIVETMPRQAGPAVAADKAIDPHALLPSERGYYRYAGSLTTPPCSEVVNWVLLREPIVVAQADIDAFAKVFPMNARPVQNLDRRFVLMSS